MTFPNAHAGVKKLVTAQALQLISVIFGLLSAILLASGATAAVTADSEAGLAAAGGAVILSALLAIAILVLLIISLIFTLMGLSKASIDEPQNLKTAYISAVVVLIASVIGGILSVIPGVAGFAGYIQSFASLLNIAVFSFTVTGIAKLAEKLGRQDMVKLGYTVLIAQIAQILLNSIAKILPTVLALSIIASIAAIVCYLFYIVYLSKSAKMLES